MIRQNKKMLLLTSIITLLPVFIGLFLWNQLPDSVATHFGLDNQPDGYSSKAFAVFGLPLILLAVHLVCVVATKILPCWYLWTAAGSYHCSLYFHCRLSVISFLQFLHCRLVLAFLPQKSNRERDPVRRTCTCTCSLTDCFCNC